MFRDRQRPAWIKLQYCTPYCTAAIIVSLLKETHVKQRKMLHRYRLGKLPAAAAASSVAVAGLYAMHALHMPLLKQGVTKQE